MTAASPLKVLVPIGLSFGVPAKGDPDGGAMEIIRRLQGQGIKLEITAVGIGGLCAEEALLAALARGADRGIKAETSATDTATSSVQLTDIVRRERPDLVLLGDRDVEDPGSQIGPRLAAILGRPYASGVSEVKLNLIEKRCRVVREMEGRCERLDLVLPAVVGVSVSDGDIPILSLYDIIAARSKPIKRIKAGKPGNAKKADLIVLGSKPAVPTRKCRMVSSADELITALLEEAHVI